MSLLARTRSWLRSISHESQLHRDMDDELRFHIESYIDDLVRRGVSRQEAARRARIEFGSTDAHKEAMRVSLGLRFWDELRSDLRFALRMLRKSPSFTTIALLSLTLGIGVNTTIFTLAKHILLDRLNVPHPEQLRLMNWTGSEELRGALALGRLGQRKRRRDEHIVLLSRVRVSEGTQPRTG